MTIYSKNMLNSINLANSEQIDNTEEQEQQTVAAESELDKPEIYFHLKFDDGKACVTLNKETILYATEGNSEMKILERVNR